MEKCKFCQQELAEDSTVCPHCGKDNAETEKEETAEAAAEVKEEAAEEKTCEKPAEEKPEEPSEAKEEPAEKQEDSEREAPAEQQEAEKPAEEKEPAEKKPEEQKKGSTPGQIALAVVVIIALAAILIALIISALGQKKDPVPTEAPVTTQAQAAETTEPVPSETVPATIPADGNPEDATCKGSYTAEAEALRAAANDVVATMAEFKLTNAQLQIYYWKGIQAFLESNPYAVYMVDMNQPLDTQVCPVAPDMTWQQFFLANALASWQNYQSMAAEAEANKIPQDPEVQQFINDLPGEIEKDAKEYGFQDGAAMLAANVGPGATITDYVNFMRTYQRGYGYYMYFLSVAQPDDAALEKYYEDHKDVLEEGGITKDAKAVNVRHILMTPADAASEDSWKDAEKQANDLLQKYLDGEKTEEIFAALADEHTQDPGSKGHGGLYENVVLGQMVPEFEQWCFDDDRKVGDTGVVKTDYGYHIMFYSGDHLIWKEQTANLYLSDKTDELMQKNAATYPLTVDYSKVLLGLPTAAE